MSKKPEDYYNDSKSIVADLQGGNFEKMWLARAPNAKTKLYQENPDLIVALSQKQVDVALVSEFTAYSIIEKLGDRAKGLVVGDAFASDPQAIILPRMILHGAIGSIGRCSACGKMARSSSYITRLINQILRFISGKTASCSLAWKRSPKTATPGKREFAYALYPVSG